MAHIVIDFDIETHVNGECASSCARLFLAGTTRTMSRGSKLGFHRSFWRANKIKAYYEGEKDRENWADPFEFAEWLYDDTQAEMHEALEFMVNRGVDPLFAIQTFQSEADDMWYPWRARLLAAGVLTE